MPERRTLLQSFRTRARFWCPADSGIIYAVGGLTKAGDSLSTVEMLHPKSSRWEMAESMTFLRSRVGVAVMHGKLFAIGGYNGSERLSTVCCIMTIFYDIPNSGCDAGRSVRPGDSKMGESRADEFEKIGSRSCHTAKPSVRLRRL